MKKTYSCLLAVGTIAATALSANAAVIQTLAGPDVASGGGTGNTLIDLTNDTGDWMTALNAGGTMYFGFDWTVNNNAGEAGGGGFFGGLAFYDGATERGLIGNDWLSVNFGLGRPGAEDATTTPYVVGTAQRLVAKMTIVDGGTDNDILSLFVNQATEGTADATLTFTIDEFTQLTHRTGNGAGQATLANLIVADDFASALAAAPVPEPSSTALLGLGGLALILRRRK